MVTSRNTSIKARLIEQIELDNWLEVVEELESYGHELPDIKSRILHHDSVSEEAKNKGIKLSDSYYENYFKERRLDCTAMLKIIHKHFY